MSRVSRAGRIRSAKKKRKKTKKKMMKKKKLNEPEAEVLALDEASKLHSDLGQSRLKNEHV